MSKWNLIVDVGLCHNCGNCVLTNQDEHQQNDFPGYAAPQVPEQAWIRIERQVRGQTPMVDVAYRPTLCNHCDNAPCVAAGGGAVYQRDDGIVIVDPQRARGRRDLLAACPYGAMSWNEELQLPQIWIFDAHLLDQGWREPRCSQACPTGALTAVKVSDQAMGERAREEALAVLQPELGTRPRVYYRNLHRFDRTFIGGSVVFGEGAESECVADAEVLLSQAGQPLQRTRSDDFGDFKFDRLPTDSGRYQIDFHHPQFGRASVDTELTDSRYLGLIRLDAGRPTPATPAACAELHHD